jgi:hypothetical protein
MLRLWIVADDGCRRRHPTGKFSFLDTGCWPVAAGTAGLYLGAKDPPFLGAGGRERPFSVNVAVDKGHFAPRGEMADIFLPYTFGRRPRHSTDWRTRALFVPHESGPHGLSPMPSVRFGKSVLSTLPSSFFDFHCLTDLLYSHRMGKSWVYSYTSTRIGVMNLTTRPTSRAGHKELCPTVLLSRRVTKANARGLLTVPSRRTQRQPRDRSISYRSGTVP